MFGATVLLAACADSQPYSANPGDATQVALGKTVYEQHCGKCHGANLEGQPNWRKRNADGKLPAPPHDDSGHTWHHPDQMLVDIIKQGMVPPFAPEGYQSDMAAWQGKLSDEEIWATLAYIKSRWSEESRRVQREINEKDLLSRQ